MTFIALFILLGVQYNHLAAGIILIYLSTDCQEVKNLQVRIPHELTLEYLSCEGGNKAYQIYHLNIQVRKKNNHYSLTVEVDEINYDNQLYTKIFPLEIYQELQNLINKKGYFQIDKLKIKQVLIKYARNLPLISMNNFYSFANQINFKLQTEINGSPLILFFYSQEPDRSKLFFRNSFFSLHQVKIESENLVFPKFHIAQFRTSPSLEVSKF